MAKKKIDENSQQTEGFDFSNFEGFNDPTTTPTPDIIFDQIMQELHESELKVLLYIIRRTYGFKKKKDNISLNQLVDGITTKDGKILDRGTGMSKSSVKRALQSLKEKNLINAKRNRDPKKGYLPTTYSLNRLDDPRPTHGPRDGSPADQGLAHQRPLQQTVKQQTDFVVVNELIRRGISKKVAEQLAQEYPKDLIREKVELLDYLIEIDSSLISRNPAGYLRKAIIEDYEPPKDFQTHEQREAERIKREQLQQEFIAVKQAEKEKEQARIDRIVSTYQIPPDLVNAWVRVMDQLELDLQKKVIDEWFHNTFLLSVDDGVAIVGVESRDAKKWLESRAGTMIGKILTGILNLGESITVEFEIISKELLSD